MRLRDFFIGAGSCLDLAPCAVAEPFGVASRRFRKELRRATLLVWPPSPAGRRADVLMEGFRLADEHAKALTYAAADPAIPAEARPAARPSVADTKRDLDRFTRQYGVTVLACPARKVVVRSRGGAARLGPPGATVSRHV